MPDGAAMAEMMHDELLARGWPVFEGSARTRRGAIGAMKTVLAARIEQVGS